ncbi:MAG: hypothetical protein JOZ69_22565 [Myxococcales bacterium]|nr:hypothetical protein [Myxococcales bacterium]
MRNCGSGNAPRRSRVAGAVFSAGLAIGALGCSGENTTGVVSSVAGDRGLRGFDPCAGLEVCPRESGPPPVDLSCLHAGVAAACKVRFSADIFPQMKAAGAWLCASAPCHGGTTMPAMSDDLGFTYTSLVNFVLTGTATRYVQPCDPDVTRSAIACNLGSNASCGAAMPLASGGAAPVSDADRETIARWVACGSPNN